MGNGCQCPGVLTPSLVSLTEWEVGKVIPLSVLPPPVTVIYKERFKS